MEFLAREPSGDIAADYRAASICAMVFNVARNPEKQSALSAEDCLVRFADAEPEMSPEMAEAFERQKFQMLAMEHNARLAHEAGG